MSKVLVCQCYIIPDNYNSNHYEYSFESVKRYCDKFGFDYHNELYESKNYKPFALNNFYFERYKFVEKLEEYDHVLYLDSDIIVNNFNKNIIDEYKDKLGLGVNYSIVNDYLEIDSYKFNRPLNSGVLLFNRKTNNHMFPLHKWPNTFYDKTPWYKSLDQYSHLTYRWHNKYHLIDDEPMLARLIPIMQIPSFHIDYEWNTFATNRDLHSLKNSYFLHYGMSEGKKQLIKNHYNLIMEQ